MRAVSHGRHAFVVGDDVVAHWRRGLGRGADSLLFQYLADGFRSVDDDPVVPAYANFEHVAVLEGPLPEYVGGFWRKFVADADQWVAFGARDCIEAAVAAEIYDYGCGNVEEDSEG